MMALVSSYDGLEIDEDEYAKLMRMMNQPWVEIDNEASDNTTIVRVHSMNKHRILLGVIQVLTDLNLIITKAYITSDGCWFMDVFNVTDPDGNKIWDKDIFSYIQTSIISDAYFQRSSVGVMPSKEYTSVELTGTDRPGLLSEVCAVLTDLKCNVVKAEVWTHNTRAAAIVHVTDGRTGHAIEDPEKVALIRELLCNVVRGDGDSRTAKSMVPAEITHTGRRLHQLMFDDRDYQRGGAAVVDEESRPRVTVMDCLERDYTVVILRSKDRPKLLFDTICTLTDMQYVVFHGTVDAGRPEAYQEYYIRHVDGLPVRSEAERERLIQCLEAAVERRASEGLELELRTEDRVGLLSDITRIFRENGLSIRRAEILTKGGKAVDSFYVSEMSGNPVEAKTVESIRRQIGLTILRVKQNPPAAPKPKGATGFLFGNLFKGCTLQGFRLVRSYS